MPGMGVAIIAGVLWMVLACQEWWPSSSCGRGGHHWWGWRWGSSLWTSTLSGTKRNKKDKCKHCGCSFSTSTGQGWGPCSLSSMKLSSCRHAAYSGGTKSSTTMGCSLARPGWACVCPCDFISSIIWCYAMQKPHALTWCTKTYVPSMYGASAHWNWPAWDGHWICLLNGRKVHSPGPR